MPGLVKQITQSDGADSFPSKVHREAVPKFKLAGFVPSVPVLDGGCTVADLLALNTWQPTIVAKARRTTPSVLALLRFATPFV